MGENIPDRNVLIVKKPTLILADEAMVIEILRDMSRNGATVIITTHRDHVRAKCDSLFEVGSQ